MPPRAKKENAVTVKAEPTRRSSRGASSAGGVLGGLPDTPATAASIRAFKPKVKKETVKKETVEKETVKKEKVKAEKKVPASKTKKKSKDDWGGKGKDLRSSVDLKKSKDIVTKVTTGDDVMSDAAQQQAAMLAMRRGFTMQPGQVKVKAKVRTRPEPGRTYASERMQANVCKRTMVHYYIFCSRECGALLTCIYVYVRA